MPAILVLLLVSCSYGSSGSLHTLAPAVTSLPLCCAPGASFDRSNCVPEIDWHPVLHGAPDATFNYSGFPRCPHNRARVEVYQTEVFFQGSDVMLPRFVQLNPVPASDYCITKIVNIDDPASQCEATQTRVFACTEHPDELGAAAWTVLGIAFFLLLLTIVAYFMLPELRTVQGQYILCMLISLLIYDVMLYPTSVLEFHAHLVPCMAIRAIKYFFFCCFFLWINVLMFDAWRTIKSRRDLSTRRRFLIYNIYVWVLGALLTTAVCVLDVTTGRASQHTTEVPGHTLPLCDVQLPCHVLLQLVQSLFLIIDFIFLILVVPGLISYSKHVSGLPRPCASNYVKQCVKLFIIMIFHTIMSISPQYLNVTVISLWQFVVLEAAAMFSIFVYRRRIYSLFYRRFFRNCKRSQTTQVVDATAQAANGINGVDSAMLTTNGITSEKFRLSSV